MHDRPSHAEVLPLGTEIGRRLMYGFASKSCLTDLSDSRLSKSNYLHVTHNRHMLFYGQTLATNMIIFLEAEQCIIHIISV